MWVSKQALALMTVVIDRAEQAANDARGELRLARQDRDTDFATAGAVERSLRERLIEAEARARAATVRAELMTLRVNQLQQERDALLHKAMPDLAIMTPWVGQPPIVMPPGADFEDMGDAAAGVGHAQAERIPAEPAVAVRSGDDEPDEGLSGSIFDHIAGPGEHGDPLPSS